MKLMNKLMFASLLALSASVGYAKDFDVQDQSGDTALIIATSLGKFDEAKKLLENGANPNIQNYEGLGEETALMIAVRNQRHDLVELLLKHGADASIRNKRGLNSLDIARNDKNSDQYVKLLEQAIANDPTGKVIVGITEANYPHLGSLQPQLMTAAFYASLLKESADSLKRGPFDEIHRATLLERLPSMISELKQLMNDDNIELNAAQKARLNKAIAHAEAVLANQ